MTCDELREQIAFCKQEGHAMRAHRDGEFARGAFEAAHHFERQLAAQQAREAGQARRRASQAAHTIPVERLPVAA